MILFHLPLLNVAKILRMAAANEISFSIKFPKREAVCSEDLAWFTHKLLISSAGQTYVYTIIIIRSYIRNLILIRCMILWGYRR